MTPILLVDDEKDNLEALTRLLRQQFEVHSSTSPFDALKLVRQKEFSVLVSDQRMPEMTGVEFLEKARQIAPRTTRILLTGYTDLDSVIAAINRGNVYRYIAKPWDPAELKTILAQAEEAYLLRRELEEKNTQLEKALEDLTRLDKAKARFLSLVSHELNTPLTAIVSHLALLDPKQKGRTEEDRRSLGALDRSANRLKHLIQEIVTFVTWEADRDFSFQWSDAKLLVDSALKGKKVKLALKVPAKLMVGCDPKKFEVALARYIDDLAQKIKSGSEISISGASSGNQVQIDIGYSGEPVSEEALAPLETGTNPLHHGSSSGLALALLKFVVEGAGGGVEIQSKSKGEAGVRLSLPGRP